MDRDQFESALRALLYDGRIWWRDIDIVEESNGKTDDGVKQQADKPSRKIYELPYFLLQRIVEPLYGEDLFSVAGAHQNLLYATKHLKDKEFDWIECVATIGPDSPPNAHTPEVLEILLHGAEVYGLIYNSDTRPIDVEGLRLEEQFVVQGEEKTTDYAAILIEKHNPPCIDLTNYTNYTVTPRLSEAFSTLTQIELGSVGMELLDYITQWKMECLGCTLEKAENGELPSHFFEVFKQLIDEYVDGRRKRLILEINCPLLPHQMHPTVFGPDYPMQIDPSTGWYEFQACPLVIIMNETGFDVEGEDWHH